MDSCRSREGAKDETRSKSSRDSLKTDNCKACPSGKLPSITQANGDQGNDMSYLGDDGIDEVPDFDDADLEVLDCWEDVDGEEEKEEGEVERSKDEIPSTIPSSLNHSQVGAAVKNSPSRDLSELVERVSSCESDETILFEDLSHLDDPKTAEHNDSLKHKSERREQGPNVTAHQNTSLSTSSTSRSAHQTGSSTDKSKGARNDPSSNNYKPSSSEAKRQLPHGCVEKDTLNERLNLPVDPTESKVDKFLKEMALQHPRIFKMQNASEDCKSLEPVSSESSNHSSPGGIPRPSIDPSDLPPGVDLEQVSQDTSTSQLHFNHKKVVEKKENELSLCQDRDKEISSSVSHIATSHVQAWGQTSYSYNSGVVRSSQTHYYSNAPHRDVQGNPGEVGESRPLSNKQYYASFTRNRASSPNYKLKKASPARSLSLSPSPPRSHPLSPIRDPYSTACDGEFLHGSHKYTKRPLYRSPSSERNRFRRSPARESLMLRELSRSHSRERVRHRSRSRNRYFSHRSSRSKHHQSPNEDSYRRYRRSSSRSRSPGRRLRSRSRSSSRHRHLRKRSPLREEVRSKRPRMSRSISRSHSPWMPHIETEWHMKSQDSNGQLEVDEQAKLNQDMARFVATNMAATGLLGALPNCGWLEPLSKQAGISPVKVPQTVTEPSVSGVDQGMPLPPPPPDISELMNVDDVKGTSEQHEMITEDQNISLSSLLESAVTASFDCPRRAIIDGCQDAIMKLHDVSIKPGRFAVISSIQVPQSNASSSYQPWQSVLNRSLANKILFSFCKTPEQSFYWESPETRSKSLSSASPVLKDILPMSSSSIPLPPPTALKSTPSNVPDMDRIVLLEKISFLTKELHDLRQILDKRIQPTCHVGVQTTPVNLCQNCGSMAGSMAQPPSAEARISRSTNFQPGRQSCQPMHPSGPVDSLRPSPVPRPVVPGRNVRPKSVSTHQVVSVPLKKQQFNTSQSTPFIPPLLETPVILPGQAGPVAHPATPNLLATGSLHETSPSLQPSSSTVEVSSANPGQAAKIDQTLFSFNNTAVGQERKGSSPAPKSNVPNLKLIPPLVQEMRMPSPKTAINKSQKAPLKPSDFDVTNYQMVGDEHLFDLISYLRSTGLPVDFDPRHCSPGQTVDRLLKSVIGSPLNRQVLLMLGLYNGFYSPKVLAQYKQLVGYLRKRCQHLVVIEPPPIPKWVLCKKHWKSFEEDAGKAFLMGSDGEKVSIVYYTSIFLNNAETPNPSLFVNSERIGINGLQIISEELLKVIAGAKKKKFG